MKRIGINALYLIPGGVGGTEIYLRELLKALAQIDTQNEYFVFANLETAADLIPKQANFHWKQQAIHARNRVARILWEQIALPIEASRYHLDVMFNPGFTAPIFCPCPCVTVFHDLQHKRHPEYFRWFDLPFWRMLLWMSAHRSRTLIAVSEATRRRSGTLLSVHQRPSRGGFRTASPKDFFALDRSKAGTDLLCVSTLHPHKNLERLIRAFSSEPREFKLVLAGMRGFHAEVIDKLIADLNCAERVRITGWIPRDELMQLYSTAGAFIYPSTFEGFGMPVLEAMAAGIPVACSSIAPCSRKWRAIRHCLFFDPLDEAAISDAIDQITSGQYSRSGRDRAREFTWTRAAEATLGEL